MKLYHICRYLVSFFLISSLVSCGQKGPLYLPGEDSAYGPPNYSIFHSPDYQKWQQKTHKDQD